MYIDHIQEELTKIIGKPALVPEWVLGWHQCKYGWKSSDAAVEVYKNYETNKFPLDVMWADIDYMDEYKDFTIGESWRDMDGLIAQLHKDSRYFVPIIDAGIAYKSDAFKAAAKSNLIKNPIGNIYFGKVWPGKSAFPDFLE